MKNKKKTIYIIVLLINILFITIPISYKNYKLQENINLLALSSNSIGPSTKYEKNEFKNFDVVKKINKIAVTHNSQSKFKLEKNKITVILKIPNSKSNFYDILNELKKEVNFLKINSIEADFSNSKQLSIELVGNRYEEI